MFYMDSKGKPASLTLKLTRPELEQVVAPVLESFKGCVRTAVENVSIFFALPPTRC